jgi:hypothetical protein
MADQTGLGSTGMDLTKVNPYGATDEQLKEIQDALKQNITSLQNRYAQPNWFKVAAGFAKPQLGGFLASLGSANEALGENVEKQREIEIPVAQMRSQLALGQSMLSKRKEVSDDIAKWKTDHKGQLPPPDLIAEWAARSPDLPAVQAIVDQQKSSLEQQSQALQILRGQYESGAINKSQYSAGLAQLQGRGALPENPPPSNKEPSPTEENKPIPFGSRSFGTDPKILDNLEHVESGGDRFAHNKESGASGPYQFTPDTLKYMSENGIDFNPFDRKEARAAADWLIQDKARQQGGDLQKGIAAYGGFTKKDPTKYVSEVLKGVDLSNPPVKNVPNLTIESSGIPGTAATEYQTGLFKAFEQPHVDRVVYVANQNPTVTGERAVHYDRAADILSNPKLEKAMGQLFQDQGFTTGLLNAMQKGFSIGMSTAGGGSSVSVSFPVEEFLQGKNIDPDTREALIELDRIISNDSMEDIRAGSQALGGGHMNQAEFTSTMNRIANSREPIKAMKKFIAQRAIRNEYIQNLNGALRDWRNTPNYSNKPASAFFDSKDVNNLEKKYRTSLRDVLKAFD